MDSRIKALVKLTERIDKLCNEAKAIEPTFTWSWGYETKSAGGSRCDLFTDDVYATQTELTPTGSTM